MALGRGERLLSDERQPCRERRRLAAVGYPELAEDLVHVTLDRPWTEKEPGSNFGVREMSTEERQNLPLPRGQATVWTICPP